MSEIPADSNEETEMLAAFQRVWEANGGEWKYSLLHCYLFTEDLDLKMPKIRRPHREETWTTIDDKKENQPYLHSVSLHDGHGRETLIVYHSDGSEFSRIESYFDAEGKYVSDYGDFVEVKTFDDAGRLVEEKDLNDSFPIQTRYFYEGKRLTRIESRDPEELQVEELHYDQRGRLSTVITHLDEEKEVLKRTFSYDESNQLIESNVIQEGVKTAWDRHRYTEDGRQETITHTWLNRITGQFGGRDITTRFFNRLGILSRETCEFFHPDRNQSPLERTEENYDEKGQLLSKVFFQRGRVKTVETVKRYS